MRNKHLRALAAIGVIALAAPLMAQKELSKGDKQWMEVEVAAIITDQEKAMFQQIDEDDRKLFKELFWLRRDFDPRTSDNEYRDGYEQRVKTANDNFKGRGRKGSESDMGKIFLLLGAPDDQQAGAGAPTTEPAGAEIITWVYNPNPSLGIPDGVSLEFRQRDQFGYRLANAEDVAQSLGAAKERMIANMAVGYSLDENGRLRKPDDKFDPNSPAKQVLSALRSTGETSSDIAFTTTPSYFQASGGEIYVPLDIAISAGPTSDNLTFFYSIEDGEGYERAQTEEPVVVTKDAAGRSRYEYPLQLPPGAYTLYIGLLDPAAQTHGTQIVDLNVPSLEGGDTLTLSSIVMFSNAERTGEVNGVPGKAFQLAGYHFKPKGERVYSHSEQLSGVLNAYNYGLEGDQPNLTIQVSFFKGDEPRGQTEDAPFVAQAAQMALTIFDIPLSIPNFKDPGEYKITIVVTDHVKNQTAEEEIEIVVEGG
jgi:GWxTD domain-containing protein